MSPFLKIGRCKSFSIMLLVMAVTFLFTQKIKGQSESVEDMISMIDKNIDPDYVYDYEKSKFVPPPGKTLLIMGQTIESITEYIEQFPDQKMPGGFSAYWGVPEFSGITEPHRNTAGVTQHHQMLVDTFPNTVIQSAMWMVGKGDVAKKAGKGEYDSVIKKYCAWARSANRPIYLRMGYEFDGSHTELEPEDYIRAYIHIADLIRAEGADNIAFVWHSYAAPTFKDYPLSAWYPGDDYVDWVALSVFGHAYEGTDFGPYADRILELAKAHKKPVMIAESNPIHGIEEKNNEVWNLWFANFFTFTYSKNIRAISFINQNWPASGIQGISDWKDSRLSNNKVVSEAWFKETNEDRYLKQSPNLFEQLGYSQN